MKKRFYRRQAVFVRDPRPYCTPLDRNDRSRLLTLAEGLERRTKAPGRKNGALGAVGLEVLRALLKRMNYASGLCFPSYLQLQLMTGRCRSAVAAALKRLETAGIIKVTRRLKRIVVERLSPITGLPERITLTTQDSNLYAFDRPDALASDIDGIIEAWIPPSPRQVDNIMRLVRRFEEAESAIRPETLTFMNLLFGRG